MGCMGQAISLTGAPPVSNPFSFDDLPDGAYARQSQIIQTRANPFAPIPFSPSTLWRKVAAGEFPKPVKLAANVTAWRVGEVRTWMQKRGAA
jgi:hypothetical protein